MLPPIDECDFERAVLDKSLTSALGWDHIHPRLLLQLPRSTKGSFNRPNEPMGEKAAAYAAVSLGDSFYSKTMW